MKYFTKLTEDFYSSFAICEVRFLKNKIKKLFVITLFLLSSTVFAGDSFLKNKTITGCENAEGYPPFINENKTTGKLEGYSVELLNYIFKDSGAKIQYRLIPWKRCMVYMAQGDKMDIVLAAASSEERRNKYLFSDVVAKVHLSYFYDHKHYPNGLNIENKSDFDKLKVCGMRGFLYGNYGLSKKVYQSANSFQQLVNQVIRRRCDAFLIRYEVFNYLPKAYPDFENHDRLRGGIIPWRKDDPINFYFLARKDSVYHKKLIVYINMKMKQIEKSGQFKKIKKKYGLVTD
jgi:polar amino acid transport system substrate-binding protein